jgi:hypothetical protein
LQGSIQHIEVCFSVFFFFCIFLRKIRQIYKKPDGFKIKGQPRFYTNLEMLILSLRKEGKETEDDAEPDASEDNAPMKSPRPERAATGNSSPVVGGVKKSPRPGEKVAASSPQAAILAAQQEQEQRRQPRMSE